MRSRWLITVQCASVFSLKNKMAREVQILLTSTTNVKAEGKSIACGLIWSLEVQRDKGADM